VARDLEAGRFLLLIAGDGIAEGTRRIGEYLSAQAGLAFDLGLIEIAEYRFHDPLTQTERRIVQPRLLARTNVIDRLVRSDVPGIRVETETEPPSATGRRISAPSERYGICREFVNRFVAETQFDDPSQMPPRAGGLNWMRLPIPGPASLTLYRTEASGEIGVFLKYAGAEGLRYFEALAADRSGIDAEFQSGGLPAPRWMEDSDSGTVTITAPSPLPWTEDSDMEQRQWFGRIANQFVNSFRPRIERINA